MAIRQGNFPFRVPYPANTGGLGQSFTAKVIGSADTTLVTDTNDEFRYNLLLNDSADADTDINIPCFILPVGTIVEDIGIENFQVWTESVGIILGDTANSDGWVDTIAFISTTTDALGQIRWMTDGLNARMFATTGSHEPFLLLTQIFLSLTS